MSVDLDETAYDLSPNSQNDVEEDVIASVASSSEWTTWRDDLAKQIFDEHESRRIWTKKEEKSLLDILADVVVRDRATGIAVQTAEDITSDWHLDDGNEENEEIEIEDIPSPMSVNQTIHSANQSGRRRKGKLQIDRVAGFNDIAEKMCTNFYVEANVRMTKLTDSLPVVDNYPKYLAMELNRLGFYTNDNLSISKSMRMDPSNVEVFKVNPKLHSRAWWQCRPEKARHKVSIASTMIGVTARLYRSWLRTEVDESLFINRSISSNEVQKLLDILDMFNETLGLPTEREDTVKILVLVDNPSLELVVEMSNYILILVNQDELFENILSEA
ncbi:hypothetical protein FNV43_RR04533 [Rhamnella rubrinervis]|uniref:Uncharacterized protein n=1 Tax=Rhamnella rubrinervis TaxID=2594499 RepID=A0A8K0MPN0_9ROSA|nr:hypothetical protein FNV43_RR04533 [Rhamnella rubrinervis]